MTSDAAELQNPTVKQLQCCTDRNLVQTHTVAYSRADSCEVNNKMGEVLFGFADGQVNPYLSSNLSCPAYCAW